MSSFSIPSRLAKQYLANVQNVGKVENLSFVTFETGTSLENEYENFNKQIKSLLKYSKYGNSSDKEAFKQQLNSLLLGFNSDLSAWRDSKENLKLEKKYFIEPFSNKIPNLVLTRLEKLIDINQEKPNFKFNLLAEYLEQVNKMLKVKDTVFPEEALEFNKPIIKKTELKLQSNILNADDFEKFQALRNKLNNFETFESNFFIPIKRFLENLQNPLVSKDLTGLKGNILEILDNVIDNPFQITHHKQKILNSFSSVLSEEEKEDFKHKIISKFNPLELINESNIRDYSEKNKFVMNELKSLSNFSFNEETDQKALAFKIFDLVENLAGMHEALILSLDILKEYSPRLIELMKSNSNQDLNVSQAYFIRFQNTLEKQMQSHIKNKFISLEEKNKLLVLASELGDEQLNSSLEETLLDMAIESDTFGGLKQNFSLLAEFLEIHDSSLGKSLKSAFNEQAIEIFNTIQADRYSKADFIKLSEALKKLELTEAYDFMVSRFMKPSRAPGNSTLSD